MALLEEVIKWRESNEVTFLYFISVPGKVQLFLTETPILFILCPEMLPSRRDSPYPQKSRVLMHLQVYYTHCNTLLCFESSKRNSFQHTEMFRVGAVLMKTTERHMHCHMWRKKKITSSERCQFGCIPSHRVRNLRNSKDVVQMLTSRPHPEYPASQNSPAQRLWSIASTCKGFSVIEKGDWAGTVCWWIHQCM